MTNAEHSSKAPHSTGIFATLGAFLHARGSGAPKVAGASRRPPVRLLAIVLGSLAGLLLFASPALAAAPEVLHESASNRGETNVWFEAEVNPNGDVTTCEFQYGTEASLATSTTVPCEPKTLEGSGAQGVRVKLTGLATGTTYYFRAVAENAAHETTDGEIMHVMTILPPETPEERPASELTKTTAKLNGVLNPGNERKAEPGIYEFVYSQSATECGHRGHTNTKETPELKELGYKQEAVSADVSELQPDTIYTYCLRTETEGGAEAYGPPETFTTRPGPPIVYAESFSNVGSSSAQLRAQMAPSGELTTYHFEYATEAEYASSKVYNSATMAQSAGAGSGVVSVLTTVEGLAPDTVYHFRVVASNAKGETSGSDLSFSTFPVGLLGLPDGRGYELVSPLEDGNATVVLGGRVRAAADGSALAYEGTAPPVGGNGNGGDEEHGGFSAEGDNEYLSERAANGGWTATDIQPVGLNSAGYVSFSGELSVGILGSDQAVTPEAPNSEALYSRTDSNGSYALLGAGAGYAGSTANGGHILVSSGPGGLYETNSGELEAVNALPEGGSAADAVFGSPRRHESEGVSISMIAPDLDNVISSDGSRVFWTETDGKGNPLRLFVSEDVGSAGERTVQLDSSQVHGNGGGGRFAGASSDGSRVFFTDCNQLTADSTAVPTPDCEREVTRGEQSEARNTPAGDDLYEYDLEAGTLTDLTVASGGEHANVVGVLGVSEDGSYVYFAAAGALAAGATPQECVQPTFDDSGDTECNVYVVHDGGAPEFVAAVTTAEWADWATVVGEHSAYVAPKGGQLVFDSTLNLTAFNSGGADEIYTYTPGSRVSCVSCNPSGTVVPGPATNSGLPSAGAQLAISGSATYVLRDVSADGRRVFFETVESLVPRDQNGLTNVYEWEVPGEGGCVSADSAYSAANDGCLYLLSSGTSTDASHFVDASESGDDVFIETRSDLVPQDRSEAFAVYDVRVGATEPPAEPQCTGTGCQGVPGASPIFATPSSVTFNGVGNFPPPPAVVKPKPKTVKCAKGKTLNHGKCTKVKAKKKKNRAKKSAHINRRAPR